MVVILGITFLLNCSSDPSILISTLPCDTKDCVSAAVSGKLYLLKQDQPYGCWATVLTMMLSWKEQKPLSVKESVSRYGKKFEELYLKSNTNGILVEDEVELYDRVGLSMMRQLNPSIQGWAEFIQQYGPLSLTIDARPPYGGTIHALLLVGIHGNINGQATTVRYIDPSNGMLHTVAFMDFLKMYEAQFAVDWPIQVIHFPTESKN